MVEPFDLRIVDQVELAVGLIDDLAVGQHAGAVNQSADRAVCLARISSITALTAAASRTSTER